MPDSPNPATAHEHLFATWDVDRAQHVRQTGVPGYRPEVVSACWWCGQAWELVSGRPRPQVTKGPTPIGRSD